MTLVELVRAARFTVLLGKNGAGKSTHLRNLDSSRSFKSKYLTPERGGILRYDPNVDQNIANNQSWIDDTRRQNRNDQFRAQSATQFRILETLVLREIEKDSKKRADTSYTFDSTLDQINELLPAIALKRAARGFKIFNRQDEPIAEENISSGESELIALAIEVLVFAREPGVDKVLLMDEPDVHLHPDLQQRFISFVAAIAVQFKFKVVVATHSTAIIAAFPKGADLIIVPVRRRDQADFQFFEYSEIGDALLPIFGAHPLSAQFNRLPPLLVEGDDDCRVVEQVVRSSNGRYLYAPCAVEGVGELSAWEKWLDTYLPSIYDDPKGYSLRDLDDSKISEINDLSFVTRARLNCYAIENIVLCDESLAMCGHTAESFLECLREFAGKNPKHPRANEVVAFIADYENRRTHNIKDLRNLVVGLLGIIKPWEVHVGQLIAGPFDRKSASPNSLRLYLGQGVLTKLFPSYA